MGSYEATPQPDSPNWEAVKPWRRRTRDALIAQRLALDGDIRRTAGHEAKQRLTAAINLRQYDTLGIYWPIRGEIDVRDLARAHVAGGGRVGLPVVVTRSAPVEFWNWEPGTSMGRGLWGIPVPRERRAVYPDALIIPLVGFDSAGYRLGYGGGYYDRTLAATRKRPLCIGLGYSSAALATIWPQPHDVPMDVIVTEQQLLNVQVENHPR